MTATTPAPHSLPYMTGDDPLADVALAMKNLADRVELRLPLSGTVTVSVVAAQSGTATITFPAGRYATAPRIVATNSNTGPAGSYYVRVASKTTTSASLEVVHRDGTALTNDVAVDWLAVPAS